MRSLFPLLVLAASWPATAATWYYCDPLRGYYPQVQTCPTQWRPVQQADPSPPQPNKPAAAHAPVSDTSFRDGLRARSDWRTWRLSLEGDYKAGAEYWISHRDLTSPGSCDEPIGVSANPTWTQGCTDAKTRLTPIDRRLKIDSGYRRGWASYRADTEIVQSATTAGKNSAVAETKTESAAVPPPTDNAPAVTQSPVQPIPASAVTEPAVQAPKDTQREINKEAALIEAVKAAMKQYEDGQNDMQKGASRPIRARAICAALPDLRAHDWTGTIDTLDTNGEGKGVLSIRLDDNVHVETWNNALSDVVDKTLIDPASPLFEVASKMHKGQRVRFSGIFPASETDCIEEHSLTLTGSITDPAFVVRFEALTPLE
jgi:hypothetical protein